MPAHGSRSVSRKAKEFGFRARTRGRKLWKRRPGCRHGSRSAVRKAKEFGFVREPEDGNYGKGGPDAGTVRARFPAKPMNSVFMREPEGGRRLPDRPHSGPCSGICTRKNLHFYTQSCIIIPTPLKTPRRSGFTAISIREIAVNPYYHRVEASMRV